MPSPLDFMLLAINMIALSLPRVDEAADWYMPGTIFDMMIRA